MRKVAVIGGGVAGIAAALEASGHGARVTLYESMPRLGGRVAGADGVDTGRHLVLSCYHEFLRLLARLDSLGRLKLAPLHFSALDDQGWYGLPFRVGSLSGRVATGLNLALGEFLDRSQRGPALSSLLQTIAMAPGEPDDATLTGDGNSHRLRRSGARSVEDVFQSCAWPAQLVERLGRPLALAMGNARPGELSAGMYLNALARVFRDPDPRAGWVTGERYGSILSDPAADVLPDRGVEVRFWQGVRWVEPAGSGWRVVTAGAERYDTIVVAVPPARLGLLDNVPGADALHTLAGQSRGHGILTLRTRLYGPIAAPGPAAEISPPHGFWFRVWHPDGGVLLERVVSGINCSETVDPDLARLVFAQRARRWFGVRLDLDRITVRYFPGATPTLPPGSLRPAIRQGPGLYYASDISATGLPATLESAARAGFLAGKLAATDSV